MHSLSRLSSGIKKISLVFCRQLSRKNKFAYSNEMDWKNIFLVNQKAAFFQILQVTALRLAKKRAFNSLLCNANWIY